VEPSIASYRNVQEVRDAGFGRLASLIESFGLPLEIVPFSDERVSMILQLDYEEGHPKPLVERFWLFPQPGVGPPPRCRAVVVLPSGDWVGIGALKHVR
jgi:hypothetical protein